ncbi:MAG: response regulator [Acidobacteriaceae bacterium]
MANILCVDDEPIALQLKCSILERAGYSATAALTVEEAITRLGRSRFDAVVTDWRLGQKCGHAIVQAAKSNPHVPVVVVSGYVAEAFHAAEPMADLYLEKPVNPGELVKIVNTLLDH